MSFDPLQFPIASFSGTPNFQTVAEPNSQNGPINSRMGRRFVPLDFNWLIYYTANPVSAIAVPVDLGQGPLGGLLDKIVSVKIDNSNSNLLVSVYFPDTGDIIDCPPNTIVTLPAMTNGLHLIVIAQNLSAGFTPKTKIFITNFAVMPSIDPQVQTTFPQFIGSNNIQRGNLITPGYGPPALGDQIQTFGQVINSLGVLTKLFGSPYTSGYIYLTNLYISAANVATTSLFEISITGSLSGLFAKFAATTGAATVPVCNLQGMNVRLDAQETWNLNSLSATNNYSLQVMLAFSVNPN